MGEVFAGRYELIDPIAEGGMGTVWRVHDRKDGSIKAAKVLRQSDAASLLRFMREQSMRIDHAHVVMPLSWAGEDDRVLFTMPLVRGGSVATLIGDHGPLPLHWVVELLDQTLAALDAVHAVGIVHRDVKPGNLLLEPTGRGRPHVRLSDFGIAAPIDEPRLTRASVVMGSAGYIAPEQLRGADPDPRQDIFGAGNVALEMLTGLRPPYEPDALVNAEPPPPVPLSRKLLDLLMAAIDDDPNRRPASAAQMRTQLRGLGLLDFDPPPDDIRVFDVLSVLGRAAPGGGPPTPVTPVAPAQPVRRDASDDSGHESSEHPGRAASWAPYVLILIGIVCLAGAGWILLTL